MASGAVGLLAAAVFPVADRLPFPVFFAMLSAVMGIYVGVLLSGTAGDTISEHELPSSSR